MTSDEKSPEKNPATDDQPDKPEKSKGPTSPWTDDRVKMLAELWARGRSARDIAATLGNTTRNSVIGKLHRLRLRQTDAPPSPKSSEPEHMTIEGLSDTTCRWPYGDPRQPGFYFCGNPVDPGTTYCQEHQALAYQKARQRNRRPPQRTG